MAVTFNPMQHRPPVSEDEFSITVLVYDEDLETTDLGYFDFESQEWKIFGDLSLKLKCWCLLPSPKGLSKVELFKTEIHNGYRD